MIESREDWRAWVTPKGLRSASVHRWYAFPHSFTGDLVEALIDEWALDGSDRIADPFVGAGTTVLAAKKRRVPAVGYDLSPFAVFVTRVKASDFNVRRLDHLWGELRWGIEESDFDTTSGEYPELVRRALPPGILATFGGIDSTIANLASTSKYKNFFRLALLAIVPHYSRAVASGGWLKWIGNPTKRTSIPTVFADRVELMLEDVRNAEMPRGIRWKACKGDARALPESGEQFSAVITSPPYPNRHDYTRVFGVELMFGFLNWEQTRKLRYQSIHSHPEARPQRPQYEDYSPPRRLQSALSKMKTARLEGKILEMIQGYFVDMHLCLKECRRIVKRGGMIAFVVGNAQYRGCRLLVDELLAEIGIRLGLAVEGISAVRFRGNSAQQMGEFGRRPARESIVVFRKGK